MFVVITGGSGSGKSAYAEKTVQSFGAYRRIYVATMDCHDQESVKRIKRHREMRSGKGFETLECPRNLAEASIPEESVVLLECMSNLAANEMFAPEGAGERTVEAVMEGVTHLLAKAAHVVVVTNEIFSDGYVYDPDTTRYQEALGMINQQMAKLADAVVEVVCGIPLCLKGKELPV